MAAAVARGKVAIEMRFYLTGEKLKPSIVAAVGTAAAGANDKEIDTVKALHSASISSDHVAGVGECTFGRPVMGNVMQKAIGE